MTREEILEALKQNVFDKAHDALWEKDGKKFHAESFERGSKSLHETVAELVEALEWIADLRFDERDSNIASDVLTKFKRRFGMEE